MSTAPRVVTPGVEIGTGPETLRLRGHEQMRLLAGEMNDWLSGNAPLVVTMSDDGMRLDATFTARKAPDLARWGLLLGEALHTYRTALDGLTSELARLDGAVPKKPKRIFFPIKKTEREWDNAVADMESIPAEFIERMSAAQPFLAPDPDKTMLGLLSDVDNDRKHNAILIEAKALPLAMEAIGLSLMFQNGGGQTRMKMWAAPLDFTEDLVVYSWEFPTPGKMLDDSARSARFGMELLMTHDGEAVNAVDVIEDCPLLVDSIFEYICTGKPPGETRPDGQ